MTTAVNTVRILAQKWYRKVRKEIDFLNFEIVLLWQKAVFFTLPFHSDVRKSRKLPSHLYFYKNSVKAMFLRVDFTQFWGVFLVRVNFRNFYTMQT